MLPERQRRLLRSVSATLRHRDRVLSDWGYERLAARAQGLKVLFAGESGTGKTMAAQVVATELGLELFEIDLATVVTQVHRGDGEEPQPDLRRGRGLERDPLLRRGRRAVRQALRGLATPTTATPTSRSPTCCSGWRPIEGAVILATNFRRNIDDAFIRRLDFVVDFPFPEAADRAEIWRRLLPDTAPVHEDVDVGFLSARFKLSGGAIRNCSFTAAFQAADEDSAIHMRHMVRAVAQEYA